jgi:hypothetical protein
MNQTQGVILIMFGALVLWLMWSPNSAFAAGPKAAPPPDPNRQKPQFGPPNAGAVADCVRSGGMWNPVTGTCTAPPIVQG